MTPLLALRQSPEVAFEALYRHHVGAVYRYVLAVLGNPADAEDVTQTTFLNAYRAFKRGERPHNAHNWLRVIAHNVCRQRFRQAARRVREVPVDGHVDDMVAEEDDAPAVEDLRRALAQLTFKQRAALVMREFEGCSFADIAQTLDVSASAVEDLLFRARRSLREQLEEALTCCEAEKAVSRQLDGRLSRDERGTLRAHLRSCPDCARTARRIRAQRHAFGALGAVPLPASLSSFFGGGGATAAVVTGGSAGVAAKLATGAVTAAVAVGIGYQGAREIPSWASSSAGSRVAAEARPAASAPARPALIGLPTFDPLTGSRVERAKNASPKKAKPGKRKPAPAEGKAKAWKLKAAAAVQKAKPEKAAKTRPPAKAKVKDPATPVRPVKPEKPAGAPKPKK